MHVVALRASDLLMGDVSWYDNLYQSTYKPRCFLHLSQGPKYMRKSAFCFGRLYFYMGGEHVPPATVTGYFL
jgi:hypothetical protein